MLPLMNASTPYVATGTCAAPARGRRFDGRGNGLDSPLNNEWLNEVDGNKLRGVRSHFKDVVIHHTVSYNNILGVHTYELSYYKKLETDDRMTKEFLLRSDKKGEKMQPYFHAHLPLPATQANALQSKKSEYFDVILVFC